MKKRIILKSEGLGMPVATHYHEYVITKLIRFLIESSVYDVYFSAEIAGINSRRPDISVWREIDSNIKNYDKNNYEPLVTIEIAKHQRSYNYSLKAILHAFQQAPTIRESFIYSIYNDMWTKVFKNG